MNTKINLRFPSLFLPVIVFFLPFPFSCFVSPDPALVSDISSRDRFGNYWYQGKAEITSYLLEQARYGEIHRGTAVLIFVTEDFSRSKQVKLDQPGKHYEDPVKVMKMNLTKKFFTGIYPYSMMVSSFTPVNRTEHPHTIKLTATSQEWCGHTFTQLNLQKDRYYASLYSYFETEGDQKITLEKTLLEDELWNLIRLDPEKLPEGNVRIIPGLLYQRLSHRPLKSENATAQKIEHEDNTVSYMLKYEESGRSFSIRFASAFPHEIVDWEEKYIDGWGRNAKVLTTRAVKDQSLQIDYWNRNAVRDSLFRKQLEVE